MNHNEKKLKFYMLMACCLYLNKNNYLSPLTDLFDCCTHVCQHFQQTFAHNTNT